MRTSYNGYAADISRTYSYHDEEFQYLINAINKMQLNIIKRLQIGVPYSNYHIECHYDLANLLKEFNFTSLSQEALIEQKITQLFFSHGWVTY